MPVKENLHDSDSDEELEYSVQFAGRVPDCSDGSSNEDDEGCDTNDEVVLKSNLIIADKEPVVFLIGWAGCNDK